MSRLLRAGILLMTGAITAPAQSRWSPRVTAEFPLATAAIQDRTRLQFFSGYALEATVERVVRRGSSVGASMIAMGGLSPSVCGGDEVYDTCDDPRGHALGAFAVVRQYLPGSAAGAHVAATLGVGVYDIDARWYGRRANATGPALHSAAEAVTGALWRISFVVNGRAEMVVVPDASPRYVTSMGVGFRFR